LILGAQIILRPYLVKRVKLIFWLVLAFQILLTFYDVKKQYSIWQTSELTNRLLPPYQPIGFFLSYGFSRFLIPLIFSVAAALIFLFLTKYLNRRFQERFFYPEESYLGAIAILIISHPLWAVYLILIILSVLIGTLAKKIILKLKTNNQQVITNRFSPYYLWTLLAIFIIIINKIATAHNWEWFLMAIKLWRIG